MTFWMFIDNQGRWRWQLMAANHRAIADSSKSYINKKDCLEAIMLVQGCAAAPIYER